jgi:rieske iron-sulfur protein
MKMASANRRGSTWQVAPGAVPDDLKDAAAEGILAYSAVCTHLGRMLSDWKADLKVFVCTCREAFFDSMQAGKNTDGATSRPLPYLPIKAAGGKIVVADKLVSTSASREAKLSFL